MTHTEIDMREKCYHCKGLKEGALVGGAVSKESDMRDWKDGDLC